MIMFSLVSRRQWANAVVVVSAVVLSPPTVLAQDAGRFDGTWSVTLVCPTDNTALGYTYHFSAQVKNGVLHGQRAAPGTPGWVVIDDQIRSDGSATLAARGLTNIPANSAYQVRTGTPYAYTI